ncbi:hypothetical protein KCG48_01805 [Proteiniclasticum sp. BAD-10]|uniref:Uncharacterized protein n=1 Tax=Proteiniclasticum sediminis TaxID=2804028 RepID=A0A941HP30_9CLOT|nr:hypothetical protein [Proteiniclasticum sediminis]MBR0575066.1 hypothetical protein [Proteiniclasticum sediminis]
MARTWKVKNEEKREYNPAQGRTDYNIPMLGYRSALFILVVVFTTVFTAPALTGLLFEDFRIPASLLSGLLVGYAIAFAQYYIERKKKADRKFHVLALVLALFMTGLFFFLYTMGVLF